MVQQGDLGDQVRAMQNGRHLGVEQVDMAWGSPGR